MCLASIDRYIQQTLTVAEAGVTPQRSGRALSTALPYLVRALSTEVTSVRTG